MRSDDLLKKASRKINAKKRFIYHFITYIGIIGVLYAIFRVAPHGTYLPVIIVALSWGIGIAIHYFKTFGTEQLGILGINPDWEEDELVRELENLRKKRALLEDIRHEKLQLRDLDDLELEELKEKLHRPNNDRFV